MPQICLDIIVLHQYEMFSECIVGDVHLLCTYLHCTFCLLLVNIIGINRECPKPQLFVNISFITTLCSQKTDH